MLHWPIPMATSNASPNTRSIFFYFGALTLLVYLVGA